MEFFSKKEQAAYRNLLDAGCREQTARSCIVLLREGKKTQALRLIACRREALLGELHESQKQIDCLDYFVYRIKKEND